MSSPDIKKRKHSSDEESETSGSGFAEKNIKQEVDDPIAALQAGPSASKRVTFDDQVKESVDQDDEDAVQKLISDGKSDSDSKESKTKEQIEEEERQKMLVLVSNFTEDQLDRYEIFRRAAFPKAAIKRIVQSITGCTVGQNVVIAMAGIAKVFAGEVIENALDYKDELEDDGPIKPKHIREAARRLRTKGHLVPRTKKKRIF